VNEVASLPALILSGKLLITPGSEEVKVRMGDFAYIPSYQHHAFKNISETDEATFTCTIDCPRGKEGCSPPPSSNAKKD
jgi:mannose-6-phosphate isomerase-like protein (cupin superfamily)